MARAALITPHQGHAEQRSAELQFQTTQLMNAIEVS